MIPSPRPDDRLLVGVPISVDLSQRGTDLTPAGAAAYEDPSPRAALLERGLELELEVSDTSSGFAFAVGFEAIGGEGYSVRVKPAGQIEFLVNGAVIGTLELPGVGPVATTYLVSWSTEANPVATGAPDAYWSEFTGYNVATQDAVRAALSHPAAVIDEQHGLAVGGAWDGGAVFNPYNSTITGCRLGSAFHPRPMVREHWIAATAPGPSDSVRAVEAPVLPAAVAGSPSAAGPQYGAAGASLVPDRNRLRATNPLVQITVRTPPGSGVPFLGEDLRDFYGAKKVIEVQGMQVPIGWLWRRRVPQACSYVQVTVQWALQAPGVDPVDPVTLYACASQGPPVNPGALVRRALTISTDDPIGQRDTFELVPVQRGGDGETWLWLGAQPSGPEADWSLREVTIVPVAPSSAFEGDDLPNGWGP